MRKKKHKPNPLRDWIDLEAFRLDPMAELLRVAIFVRRSGLEHLIPEATYAEAEAMVRAGAVVAKDRAVILVDVLEDPARARASYDGGQALRKETLNFARSAPVEY